MKKAATTIGLLSLLLLSVAFVAISQPSAEQVRSNAFEALGRCEFTQPIALRWSGRDTEGTFYLEFDNSGRFVRRVEYSDKRIPDSMQGFDGVEAWSKNSAGVSRRMSPRHRDHLSLYVWLTSGYWAHPNCPFHYEIDRSQTRGNDIALRLHRANHDEASADHEVGEDDGDICVLVIDRKTWLPRSLCFHGFSRTFVEYQTSGNIRIPRLIRDDDDGDISSVKYQVIESSAKRPQFSRPPSMAKVKFDYSKSSEIQTHSTGGKLYVRPKVNGKLLGWCLFDSGAYRSMLTRTAVEELGIDLPQLGVQESSGVGIVVVKRQVKHVDSFELGMVKLEPWIINVGEMPHNSVSFGFEQTELAGLVGADFMQQCIVVFDLRNGRMRLHDRYLYTLPSYGHWQPLTGEHISPTMWAEVADDKGLFTVDTGASSGVFMTRKKTQQLELARDTDQYRPARGFGGYVAAYRSKLQSLSFGEHRVTNIPVTLADDERGGLEGGSTDGLIGSFVFNQFIVVFDLKGKRIAFLPL